MGRPAIAVVLCLVACATPKQRALEAATEANQRRDQVAEARALQSACALDATDLAICEQARAVGLLAARTGLAQLQPTCQSGAVERCVAGVNHIKGLGVPDAELQQLLESSRAGMWASCLAMPLAAPEDALARVRCAERYRAVIPSADYDRDCGLLRRDMGVWLDKWSSDRVTVAPAEAVAASALAECFGAAPSGAAYRGWDQLATQWNQRRVWLSARMPDGRIRSVCPGLSKHLPAGWLCAAEALPANRLEVVLELGPSQHTEQVTVQEVTYVADVQRFRNPNKADLKDDVRDRNNELKDLRTAWELAETDCAVTKSRRICARAEALRLRHNELVDDRDRVKRQSNREPDVVTREVHDTFRYNERHHIWRRQLVMTTPFNRYDEWLEVKRLERPGFAPAGIEAMSATPPTESEWLAMIDTRLGETAQVFAEKQKKDARAEALYGCSTNPAGLECSVRQRAFDQPGSIKAAGIAVLGERLPQNFAAWPKVACSRPVAP